MPTTITTICAQATPPGNGGVSIVRLSGPLALSIGQKLSTHTGQARHAHYGPFFDEQGQPLDRGISLYFSGPHSYTGEDVFELHSHGGQILVDMLLSAALIKGATLAKPGEFSERAFINDKLDLVQAEAIADLIHASSSQAARNAARSLQGDFSQQINLLLEQLINVRLFVEAAIDFPEEEIDFLADGKVAKLLQSVTLQLEKVLQKAQQGKILQEGMQVVIAGAPNAGKSSLLNALAGHERAIVTDIAGTTRDTLAETISIDGLPLHIIDTAGLRDNPDAVEKIGIERALAAIEQADHVLLLADYADKNSPASLWHALMPALSMPTSMTFVRNKIDLHNTPANVTTTDTIKTIHISAKSHAGIDLLRNNLKQNVGYDSTLEGGFSARRRHIDALLRTQGHLQTGTEQLHSHGAGELLAEDLRQAQECLNEITGQFTSDDLLGKIFGSFCIGK